MEVKTRCVLILVSALLTCISAMEAQDLAMKITKRYLNLPVSHQTDRAVMTFDVDGKQERAFDIRLAPENPDYWVFCDMSALKGKEIKISYKGNKAGINKIYQADEIAGQDICMPKPTARKFTILNVGGGITTLTDCCTMTVNTTCSISIIRMSAIGEICIGGMR